MALVLLCGAAPAPAQVYVTQSSWLEWRKVMQMSISPDSASTIIWAHTLGDSPRTFDGAIDPTRAQPWIGAARAFMKQRLTQADSGNVRTSPVLGARGTNAIYLAGRTVGGRTSSS